MLALDVGLWVGTGLGVVLLLIGLSGFRRIPNDRVGVQKPLRHSVPDSGRRAGDHVTLSR